MNKAVRGADRDHLGEGVVCDFDLDLGVLVKARLWHYRFTPDSVAKHQPVWNLIL
ncbi:MAG: hypothetical protein QF926_00375 [Alphaproteobacteria bacterium]|nr:hypothetical protein [Alphaproteobacteria bacterium]MDP6515064.1 hypothetical protein [Alphaproteobacteria bacterium]